jgi:hypothetical protein
MARTTPSSEQKTELTSRQKTEAGGSSPPGGEAAGSTQGPEAGAGSKAASTTDQPTGGSAGGEASGPAQGSGTTDTSRVAAPPVITNSREVDELRRELQEANERASRQLEEADARAREQDAKLEDLRQLILGQSKSAAAGATSSALVAQVINLRAGSVELPGYNKPLAPGVNVVPLDVWEAAKKNSTVRLLLQQGLMPNSKEGLREMGFSEGISGLDDLRAFQAIEASVDLVQVKSWLAEERRPVVAMALRERVRQLEKATTEFQERTEAAVSAGKVHGR